MRSMRNEKKKMSRDYAEAVVDKCVFFVMATTGADGEPYCVPLSMARDGEWVYFHCAQEGRKIDNLRFNHRVCISCVGNTRVPPHTFTVEYESAVIFGTAREITTRDEKTHGLRLICQRYTPDNMAAFEGVIEKTIEHTAVWKIHIDEISGKGTVFT